MQKKFWSIRVTCAVLCALMTTPSFAEDQQQAVTAAQEKNQADAAKVDSTPAPKVIWKPGEAIDTTTDTEDIVATHDINLAQKQVAAFPESPEASFILAVALTRTSRVEEALKEVQRARRLANSKGGPAYFDKMIASYEKLLEGYPEDNQVRYGLAWAYYMKAYLLGQHSRMVAKWKAVNQPGAAQAATTSGATPNNSNKEVVKALQSGNIASAVGALAGTATAVASGKTDALPHIPTALENVEPADVPLIKTQYDKALGMIDEILKRDPEDIWTIVYGAHLRAEYTGDLDNAMRVWEGASKKWPNNPAPYFFLGEGYLKKGNLRESLTNVGKAISLRMNAIGN